MKIQKTKIDTEENLRHVADAESKTDQTKEARTLGGESGGRGESGPVTQKEKCCVRAGEPRHTEVCTGETGGKR